MILTSKGATTRYTPPWMCDDAGNSKPGAPVLFLRAGDVIERGQMEAELSGPHRSGQVWGFELRQAIRAGVVALLADDPDLDRLLGLIEAEGEGETETLSADDRALLAGVRGVLGECCPDYRDLVAQLERRRAIAPIVALKRYCVGMEIEGVTFELGRDGQVSDATMSQLEPFLISVAGNRAYELQQPRGLEGNSPRPSPSDVSPKRSGSASRSKAGGKSPARAGRKTRVSRSRRGSGPSSTSGSTADASPLP
ncbi:hypothetical protein NHF48_007355 [Sphingomonas sp. H160509]|uniref:hypothetical protein n=1 Tax=Sphingomonas sp. H160509 TaxID=2955313 RepID=UPI0020981560|nr:hypothetical protein [Sphingomonas sp. H160509]MDD1450818.1 hypothetical protein [Sphingomonas sp. H160509]